MTTRSEFRYIRPLVMTLITLMSLFVAAAIGCNERGSGSGLHETNLRLVAVIYSQYLASHQGEAPRDAEDFAAFIRSLGPGLLQRAGLSGSDELLVSPRDGKPFVVKYRNRHWPLIGTIAYEQVGANGTRHIATDLGGLTEITEEEFQSRLEEPR